MYGSLIGDIVGSAFEGRGQKAIDFQLITSRSTFTDDSVLTLAVADWLHAGGAIADRLREWTRRYPDKGYGARYVEWAVGASAVGYGSFGNGAAMRVAPVAWFHDDLPAVVAAAEASALPTHDHPDGLASAVAVASGIFLARNGSGKDEIRAHLESQAGYDLTTPLSEIRPSYTMNETASGSVPQAIRCFLESIDVETAIRNAVSLGGDTDTMACIAASLSEAFHGGVGPRFERMIFDQLDEHAAAVARRFHERFVRPKYQVR